MNQLLKLSLEGDELTALMAMSKSDCRPARDELRFLIREEAKRRGLLPATDRPTALDQALANIRAKHGSGAIVQGSDLATGVHHD